jgi:hypothetical protein
MRVDVMCLSRRLKTDQDDDRKEVTFERHGPLPLTAGRRRSSERRNATPTIPLPIEAPVPRCQGSLRISARTLYGNSLEAARLT